MAQGLVQRAETSNPLLVAKELHRRPQVHHHHRAALLQDQDQDQQDLATPVPCLLHVRQTLMGQEVVKTALVNIVRDFAQSTLSVIPSQVSQSKKSLPTKQWLKGLIQTDRDVKR